MRWPVRILSGLALVVTVVLGLLLAGASLQAPRASQAVGIEAEVSVGLVQGPIHTDFLLPLDAETRADFAALDLPPYAEWLVVGWGARQVYTSLGDYSDLRLSAVWKAVTGDEAVMRFQAIGPFDPPLSITLDSAQYDRLRGVILSDTHWDQPIGRDLLAEGDRFYAAKGRFSIIRTCNQWIAEALQRSGRSFAIWTPSNWSVRHALKRFGPYQRGM